MMRPLTQQVRRVGPHSLSLFLLAGLFATACSDDPIRPAVPEVLSVAVEDDGSIFRSLNVELDLRRPVRVEYGSADGPLLRVETEAAAAEHQIFLPRLRAETEYTYTVSSLGEGEDLALPVSGTFTTGPLPPLLDSVEIETTGEPSFDLAMLELRHVTADDEPRYGGLAAVDRNGRIVWFHDTGSSVTQGWHRRPNGNIMMVDISRGLVEITPDREEVARLPQMAERPAHHDVIPGPGNTVYFITLDRQVVDDTLDLVADAIWQWDPGSGALEKKWTVFDFLSWEEDGASDVREGSWTHANSLFVGPRENVLISLRFLNQVVSIAPDFQSIEWRLGGPNATFDMEPSAVFSAQHTAAEVEPGRVLVFDNGTGRPPEDRYSRAAEVEYDLADSVATLAWEFRPAPDNYSFAVGSAFRLENGNTLTTFGFPDDVAGSYGGVQLHETDPAGNAIWTLEILGPGTQYTYRGTAMESVAGEVVVSR